MFNSDNRPGSRGAVHSLERAPITSSNAARIVAVQGASSEAIQDLLASVARRWAICGRRVAGVVEEFNPGRRKGDGGARLRNLRSGTVYELFQDLGPHSTACCLDPGGVAQACQDVIADLEDCDRVVLSKFGKLEAERGGLLEAFIAATLLEKPVLTAVSPSFSVSYSDFVGRLGVLAPPDEEYLHAWSLRCCDGAP